MSTSNKNFRDLTDEFLTNRLNASERDEYLNMIERDPLLKSEFELQRDIQEVIANQRRAQLKARLQQIDTATIPEAPSSSFKFYVAGATMAAIVFSGLVYYFNSSAVDSSTELATKTETIVIDPHNTAKQILLEQEESAKKAVISNEVESKSAEVIELRPVDPSETAAKNIAKPKTSSIKSSKKELDPAATMPAMPSDNEGAIVKEDVNLGESGKLPNAAKSSGTSTDVHTINDAVHNFHYQHHNGKVTLYGDFGPNLYELIEYQAKTGNKVYLFKDDLFYELKNGTQEITPLTPIKDKSKIADLKVLRRRKN